MRIRIFLSRHVFDCLDLILYSFWSFNRGRGRRKKVSQREPHCNDFGWNLEFRKSSTKPRPDWKPRRINSNALRKEECPTDSQYSYTSSYKKYADSYVTPRTNRNAGISQFNADFSSEYTQTSTSRTKTNTDYRKQYVNNGSERTFDSETIESVDKHENGHDQLDSSNTGIDINCQLLLFDEECIEFDNLSRIKFNEHFATGQRFHIILSQVHSPYKFWFHMKDDAENVDSLMHGLK